MPVPDTDIAAKIDHYFTLEGEIHKFFKYVEDWKVIPLQDHRNYYWSLPSDEGPVHYWKTQKLYDQGEYYSAEIYTQRFLPKWVYHTDKYTLVCMDTQTDGNKFLGIFDNAKRKGE